MNTDKALELLAKVYADNVRVILKVKLKEMIKEGITKALEENDDEVVTDIEFIDMHIEVMREVRTDIEVREC